VLLVVTLLCGLACRPPAVEPPGSVPPDLEPLYAAIRDHRSDYEKGLELIVSGDPVTGRNLLAAASDRLSVAARLCTRMPHCDFEIFVLAAEQLVLERRLAAELAAREPRPEEAEEARSDPLLEEAERTASLLRSADLAELIPPNQPVKAALNDWLTWNRPALMEAYENYQFLRPKIHPIYERAHLPEALLFAVMAQESGGKVHAYSRAGAAGPLQFMSRTARRYGLGSEDGFDLRLDPVAATRANVAYLEDQLRLLNGDLEKALAAYNVGESRVLQLHRRHRDADFWDPRIRYAVPEETRDYVPRVLAAALIFLEPERYGVQFPHYENAISSVVLRDDASLGELAICLGPASASEGWFRTLRNLNPRVDPGSRIGAGRSIEMPSMLVPVYAERCLGDAPLARLARELHDAGYPERPPSRP
jgi:membrane-bound lytic murein transglycosylase D